jgi:predicted transcriptional regulator
MAKKKRAAPKSLRPGMTVISIKATQEFHDWLAKAAKVDRITTVQLIEKAVVEYVERHKLNTKAPERTKGR